MKEIHKIIEKVTPLVQKRWEKDGGSLNEILSEELKKEEDSREK
ncbi:hypothetical protein [Clostridium septicum]|nr:hypothetical protein [Clostridium septicum]